MREAVELRVKLEQGECEDDIYRPILVFWNYCEGLAVGRTDSLSEIHYYVSKRFTGHCLVNCT